MVWKFIAVILCYCMSFAATASAETAQNLKREKYQSPQSEHVQKVCNPELIMWPLRRLTREERETRLNLLLGEQKFRLDNRWRRSMPKDETDGYIGDTACSKLLKKLGTLQGVKILEPFEPNKLPQYREKSLLKECPNMVTHKLFLDSKFQRLNERPGFDSLPLAEKERLATYTTEAFANMEYYDLSAYFGSNAWGYLGEAVKRSCVKPNCEFKLDRLDYGGTFYSVFNSGTCQISYPFLRSQASRLSFVNANVVPEVALDHSTDCTDTVYYHEQPDFTSFVEIDNKPYIVVMSGFWQWSEYAKMMKYGGDLLVSPIVSPGGKTNTGEVCTFTSKAQSSEPSIVEKVIEKLIEVVPP